MLIQPTRKRKNIYLRSECKFVVSKIVSVQIIEGVRSLAQAAQALVVRSYFFFIFMRTFRDIVTAVVYCYITTELHYAKRDSGLLEFGGVMLQRFEFTKVCMGKTLTEILA